MKKINVNEKHERSILVQKIDIKKLVDLNIQAPSSIFSSFVFESNNITLENQYDFVEFFDESIFDYFLEQDWIIDYDTYNYFSLEELLIAERVLNEELINLYNKLLQKVNNATIIKEFHDTKSKLEYMLESVKHLKQVKFNELSEINKK